MKILIFFCLILVSLSLSTQAYAHITDDEKLVFSDEFDGKKGSVPDPKKWTFETGGGGWGNNEHQYYTNSNENGFLDGNGNLVIRAKKADPAAQLACWYGNCKYTSARLITKGKFETTYGKIEARIKLPEGQGIWPAFWMLGGNIDQVSWPACGEIDILENLGHQPRKIHGTVHGPGYSGAQGIGKAKKFKKGTKAHGEFHVYSVVWSEKKIEWFVNGKRYHKVTPLSLPFRSKWVFDRDFFLLLNLAVGGNWPGYPNDKTSFPQDLVVDYVRVYK